MKRVAALLLTAVLALVLLAGCKAAPAATTAPATAEATVAATTAAATTAAQTPAAAQPVTVSDLLGNEVTLNQTPKRIVSLAPSNTEIVYALGLGDKLVGVDVMSDYPAEVSKVEKVGDFNGPNLERIAALKPDLILAGNTLQKETIDQLKTLGMAVACTEGTAYADAFTSIEIIGKLTGTTDKAAEVITDMRATETAVLDAVAGVGSGKVVYYAMSYGDTGNWTAGPGTFPYEFIEMCGAKALTEGMTQSWIDYNLEDLIKKNPDIILLSSDMGDASTFEKTEPYNTLTAVKEGRVVVVDADLCSRPGPRIVEGLKQFAETITGSTIE